MEVEWTYFFLHYQPQLLELLRFIATRTRTYALLHQLVVGNLNTERRARERHLAVVALCTQW